MRLPEPVKTPVLLLILAAVVGCVVNACADLTAPATCTNALTPVTFRLVLSTGDTVPRMTNHYLDPHRSADTFNGTSDDGRRVSFAVTYAAGYCITALDSAAWSTNHTSGWVE